MKKDWRVDFFDRNENLIEEVTFHNRAEGKDLQSAISDRLKENKAELHSVPEEVKLRWIKSKVVVFFGINNQFAGMYIADNKEQIEMLEQLVYGFPLYYKVYDDIPRIEDCIKSIKMDGLNATVDTQIEDVDGLVKHNILHTHMKAEEFQNFCKKIEEIFGKQ